MQFVSDTDSDHLGARVSQEYKLFVHVGIHVTVKNCLHESSELTRLTTSDLTSARTAASDVSQIAVCIDTTVEHTQARDLYILDHCCIFMTFHAYSLRHAIRK